METLAVITVALQGGELGLGREGVVTTDKS